MMKLFYLNLCSQEQERLHSFMLCLLQLSATPSHKPVPPEIYGFAHALRFPLKFLSQDIAGAAVLITCTTAL